SCGRVRRLMRMADLRGNVSVIIESSKASFPRPGHSLPSIEPPPDALVSRQSLSFFGVSEHTAEESGNLGSAVGRGVDLERFSDALHAPGLSPPPLLPLRKGGKVGGVWSFFPPCEGGTQGGSSSASALRQVRHPGDNGALSLNRTAASRSIAARDRAAGRIATRGPLVPCKVP